VKADALDPAAESFEIRHEQGHVHMRELKPLLTLHEADRKTHGYFRFSLIIAASISV
jgi:hypothetical protein